MAKMVTWRVAATATTILITYMVTGDVLVGATVGGVEAIAKMALYYGHERAWALALIDRRPEGTNDRLSLRSRDSTYTSS